MNQSPHTEPAASEPAAASAGGKGGGLSRSILGGIGIVAAILGGIVVAVGGGLALLVWVAWSSAMSGDCGAPPTSLHAETGATDAGPIVVRHLTVHAPADERRSPHLSFRIEVSSPELVWVRVFPEGSAAAVDRHLPYWDVDLDCGQGECTRKYTVIFQAPPATEAITWQGSVAASLGCGQEPHADESLSITADAPLILGARPSEQLPLPETVLELSPGSNGTSRTFTLTYDPPAGAPPLAGPMLYVTFMPVHGDLQWLPARVRAVVEGAAGDGSGASFWTDRASSTLVLHPFDGCRRDTRCQVRLALAIAPEHGVLTVVGVDGSTRTIDPGASGPPATAALRVTASAVDVPVGGSVVVAQAQQEDAGPIIAAVVGLLAVAAVIIISLSARRALTRRRASLP